MQENTQSLRQKIFSGTAWTLLGMGTSQVLRFGKSLFLTRLILPEAYGEMAIVWSVLFALGMLSDAGLAAAALRHKDGNNPDFMNTIWTMKITRGILLFFCTLTISYPISKFYSMPNLYWLIPIAGLISLMEGFNSTKIYSIQRNMVFGRLTLLEIGSDFIGLITVLIWAYFYPGVGALIGSAFVSGALHLVYSHTLLPGPSNRFRWNTSTVKEVLSFGKWIFFSSAIYLIYSQGDRMILGKYLTASQLGVYSIAIMLSEVVSGVLGKVNNNVFYPALSSVIRTQRERLKSVYYKTRLLIDGLMVIPVAILLVNSEHLIKLIYNVKYQEAGWMFQILCVRLLMLSILSSSDVCLLALGKSKYSLIQNSARAIIILVGIPIGWTLSGIQGVVWAVTSTEIPVALILWYGMKKNSVFSLLHELRSVLFAFFGLGIGWIVSIVFFH